jgi:hypothetical protein
MIVFLYRTAIIQDYPDEKVFSFIAAEFRFYQYLLPVLRNQL